MAFGGNNRNRKRPEKAARRRQLVLRFDELLTNEPYSIRLDYGDLRMATRGNRGKRPKARLFFSTLRDDRGSTILEFAILAGPLIALILAILETSLVFFTQQGIDTATEVAARSILTGSAQTAQLTQAQFKQAACAALPPYLSCSKLSVDVQTASSFATANVGAPKLTYDNNGNVTNNFSYSTGGAGDIVVLRLLYLWPVSKGPLGFDLSNQPGSARLLIGTSVAKTESYQ